MTSGKGIINKIKMRNGGAEVMLQKEVINY
jgi:hypothetical protein